MTVMSLGRKETIPVPRKPEAEPAAEAWIGDMHLFVEVARARSFSRAAEHLGMPYSTLSRRIVGLEKKLGFRLFTGTTRRVELTAEGLEYFARTEKVVAAAVAIHEDLAYRRGRPADVLRISIPECIALQLATPWVAEFAQEHPEVALQIDTAPEHADLVRDDFDVCITHAAVEHDTYIKRTVASLTRHLYASPDYARRKGLPSRPEELIDHQCICMSERRSAGAVWVMRRGAEEVSVAVSGMVTTVSQVLAPELATQGLGIATGMPGPLQHYIDSGALIRVLPGWQADPLIVSIVLRDRMVTARARAFVEFFNEKYQAFAKLHA